MYLSLLHRNRDFRLLYFATLISLGGDWFLTVALLDLVLELTGSATLVSLILLCQTLPIFLVTPVAGHAVDRVDRRKVMVVVDLIRVGACLLPLLARTPESLPWAFAGVVMISIGSAYFEPASHAALPNIVKADDLAAANVLMGSTWGTMLAVGAGLGGLVTMRFGRAASFVMDAASFLVSALLLLMVRAQFSEGGRAAVATPPILDSVRETFCYAREHRRVLALLVSKGGYGLGAGVIAMLGVFGREVFQAGALGIGILFAMRGVGALIGPFLARAFWRDDDALYRSISLSVLLFGLGYIGLAFSQSLLTGCVALFIAHIGGGAQWQTSTYGLQREVPDWIRGRIFSVDYGLITLTMAISGVAAGLLSDRFGPVIATVSTAGVCLAWGLFWGIWTWRLWR
ncbi:MAG TPA: MFS transporter [Thermoanaerobaculia bacterium]|nr:MFS transporter [Thermoanaerobaculia bacterium]